MTVVFVIVGSGIFVAALVRVQVRRKRTAGVRESVSADPVQLEIPVHAKPMIQFGNWGKTLAAMQLQIRTHSFSIVASIHGKQIGSVVGSEWYFLGPESTMRREHIESPLGTTWIALASSQGGKRAQVAVRSKEENVDIWSALLNAGVLVED